MGAETRVVFEHAGTTVAVGNHALLKLQEGEARSNLRPEGPSVGLAILLPSFGGKGEGDRVELCRPVGGVRVVLVEGHDELVAPRTGARGQAMVAGVHFHVVVLFVLGASQPFGGFCWRTNRLVIPGFDNVAG